MRGKNLTFRMKKYLSNKETKEERVINKIEHNITLF